MISIKDYAAQHGITYEAARQQISRYFEREIEGFRLADHVSKVGRTQYLDDDAVDFLNRRRASNPVIIQQEGRGETIERLRARIDDLQTRLITVQDEYKALLQDKHAIEMREQLLLADKQIIDSIKASAAEAEVRAETAEKARKAAEERAAETRMDLERGMADAAAAVEEARAQAIQEAREEADRLRAEAMEAEKAAEEAKTRADRMEAAGLLSRIFKSW